MVNKLLLSVISGFLYFPISCEHWYLMQGCWLPLVNPLTKSVQAWTFRYASVFALIQTSWGLFPHFPVHRSLPLTIPNPNHYLNTHRLRSRKAVCFIFPSHCHSFRPHPRILHSPNYFLKQTHELYLHEVPHPRHDPKFQATSDLNIEIFFGLWTWKIFESIGLKFYLTKRSF